MTFVCMSRTEVTRRSASERKACLHHLSVAWASGRHQRLGRHFAPETAEVVIAGQCFRASLTGWKGFWTDGAVVDLTGSTDKRSSNSERRIVLSQYLTAIQCSGFDAAAGNGASRQIVGTANFILRCIGGTRPISRFGTAFRCWKRA